MKRVIGVVMAVVLLGLVGAPSSAFHLAAGPPTTTTPFVQPVQIDGNATCGQLFVSGFLFEYKLEPVTNLNALPVSFGGLSGALTVKVKKSMFDFSLTGGFVAAGVFVKAGESGNLYDFRPYGGKSADTGLHGPVNPNNGQFFGLSHLSFCLAEGGAELEITKEPDAGDAGHEIDPGDDAVFTIKVTNKGPATAKDVEINDTLPSGLTWTTTTSGCTVTGGTNLSCDVGTLAVGASFTVTVNASTTPAACGELVNLAATASASNADDVSDDGKIAVRCGAILVQKTRKHKALGGTVPHPGVGFTLWQGATQVGGSKTTGADGEACFDGLAFGTYTVKETVPAGYAGDSPKNVLVDAVAACGVGPLAYVGELVSFVNTPLSNITVSFESQDPGATAATIDCTGLTADPADATPSAYDDDSETFKDLEPGIYSCTIDVDP